jgi:DNA modification methylase
MNAPEPYRQFLEAKIVLAADTGFDVSAEEINPALKPFVRAIVKWAAAGGRRGIFSSFGLHKTSTQIELARLCRIKTGAMPLIVLPLGVRAEFFEEAEARFTGEYAVELKFIRSTDEIEDAAQFEKPLIYLTNYESVRDGKIDTSLFGFASLDEAACLRGFGGSKTFREFMRLFPSVRYRYVATATPDPNEHIELLAYAAFLEIMDVGQAKTRFFKRNSEQADQLTLHPHKEREFWLWVASWALFVSKPSDLGAEFSDEGYVLPETEIHWHEVAADHSKAGAERDGQNKMFSDDAVGVQNAAAVKRESLPARIDKMMELIKAHRKDHCIIWHDLEAERLAIETALPKVASIFGTQDIDLNEANALAFKRGKLKYLATKPRMSGAGCNFQPFCYWEIFLGIGFKFHDFIQAIHRLVRFGQKHRVRIDLILSEREREVKRLLLERWARHNEQMRIMGEIIAEYGLAQISLAGALKRSMGVDRQEVCGENFVCVNNDCVDETRGMAENSVDLIVTSIPFSTQYEYTPSFNDFGHTDDDDHFFAQMDFLTPELFRVLRPGRIAVVHCKDRIIPGGMNGLGFQTVGPFGAKTMLHYMKHGFAYLGTKTIITDVVRENNQTYRLGWTEQCKDGTRMGFGLPEYVHVFRKPQTDRSKGYGDVPVIKDISLVYDTETGEPVPRKGRDPRLAAPATGYSRGRWQLDAHGFGRSSGDRLMTREEFAASDAAKALWDQDAKVIYRSWREHSLSEPYDFEHHVRVCETLDANNNLPPTFMLLPPHSWHPGVETDVTRMRTLNGLQYAKGKELHLCPLQFDIVDRAIRQYTMEGETVFDPFGGLMTVPYRALLMGRKGVGCELSPGYFADGVAYCTEAERKNAVPSFFDLIEAEKNSPIPEPAESDDPDQNATGGPVERPSMVAEQSGEQDAGETATASASAVLPPAYLAPGDPASVEGASADARRHAPPAFNSPAMANEMDRDEDDATASACAYTLSSGKRPEGETVATVTGAVSHAGAAESPAGCAPGPVATDQHAVANAPGAEPIELPAFLDKMPNPFTGMDRSATNTVVGKHGGTSAAVPDARPAPSPDGRASTYDPGPIPEFLLRKKSAA